MSYSNPNIPGWMSEDELQWLYEVSGSMKTIVEVGSWKGKSTHALLSGCKGTVTAVDTFLGSPSIDWMVQEAKDDSVFKEFKKNLGHFKNLKVIRGESSDVAEGFSDKSIDMVFIDTDHTYERIISDINSWLPKTRKLISGHDYDSGYPELMRGVNEIFNDVQVINSIWYKFL